MCPVARASPVMCDGKDSKFLYGDLIDDAVWKSTEEISPTSATKYSTEQRIGENELGRSFKLSHKCETKLSIGFQCIERGGIVQFGKCQRSNDQLHFSDARTCASASEIGMTCTAPLSISAILRSVSAAHASSISASSSRLASNSWAKAARSPAVSCRASASSNSSLFPMADASVKRNVIVPRARCRVMVAALKRCRTHACPMMQVHCTGCAQQKLMPHSCGHRLCPLAAPRESAMAGTADARSRSGRLLRDRPGASASCPASSRTAPLPSRRPWRRPRYRIRGP